MLNTSLDFLSPTRSHQERQTTTHAPTPIIVEDQHEAKSRKKDNTQRYHSIMTRPESFCKAQSPTNSHIILTYSLS
jgi:hypothetical protein